MSEKLSAKEKIPEELNLFATEAMLPYLNHPDNKQLLDDYNSDDPNKQWNVIDTYFQSLLEQNRLDKETLQQEAKLEKEEDLKGKLNSAIQDNMFGREAMWLMYNKFKKAYGQKYDENLRELKGKNNTETNPLSPEQKELDNLAASFYEANDDEKKRIKHKKDVLRKFGIFQILLQESDHATPPEDELNAGFESALAGQAFFTKETRDTIARLRPDSIMPVEPKIDPASDPIKVTNMKKMLSFDTGAIQTERGKNRKWYEEEKNKIAKSKASAKEKQEQQEALEKEYKEKEKSLNERVAKKILATIKPGDEFVTGSKKKRTFEKIDGDNIIIKDHKGDSWTLTFDEFAAGKQGTKIDTSTVPGRTTGTFPTGGFRAPATPAPTPDTTPPDDPESMELSRAKKYVGATIRGNESMRKMYIFDTLDDDADLKNRLEQKIGQPYAGNSVGFVKLLTEKFPEYAPRLPYKKIKEVVEEAGEVFLVTEDDLRISADEFRNNYDVISKPAHRLDDALDKFRRSLRKELYEEDRGLKNVWLEIRKMFADEEMVTGLSKETQQAYANLNNQLDNVLANARERILKKLQKNKSYKGWTREQRKDHVEELLRRYKLRYIGGIELAEEYQELLDKKAAGTDNNLRTFLQNLKNIEVPEKVKTGLKWGLRGASIGAVGVTAAISGGAIAGLGALGLGAATMGASYGATRLGTKNAGKAEGALAGFAASQAVRYGSAMFRHPEAALQIASVPALIGALGRVGLEIAHETKGTGAEITTKEYDPTAGREVAQKRLASMKELSNLIEQTNTTSKHLKKVIENIDTKLTDEDLDPVERNKAIAQKDEYEQQQAELAKTIGNLEKTFKQASGKYDRTVHTLQEEYNNTDMTPSEYLRKLEEARVRDSIAESLKTTMTLLAIGGAAGAMVEEFNEKPLIPLGDPEHIDTGESEEPIEVKEEPVTEETRTMAEAAEPAKETPVVASEKETLATPETLKEEAGEPEPKTQPEKLEANENTKHVAEATSRLTPEQAFEQTAESPAEPDSAINEEFNTVMENIASNDPETFRDNLLGQFYEKAEDGHWKLPGTDIHYSLSDTITETYSTADGDTAEMTIPSSYDPKENLATLRASEWFNKINNGDITAGPLAKTLEITEGQAETILDSLKQVELLAKSLEIDIPEGSSLTVADVVNKITTQSTTA
jgi:hypothetical protein